MADDNPEKKKEKPMTFARLNQLAIQLDSKQARTSFGKLPLSTEKTVPNYGFSHGKREDQQKVFQGELTALENIARGSPGPVYKYDDKIKFKTVPKYGFAQASRGQGNSKPKYDFYENALFLDDPIQANNSRRPRVCAPKIGTEPRMAAGHDNANPGPQYLYKDRPNVPKAPEYTFGPHPKPKDPEHAFGKSGKGGSLKNLTSTPAAVGPGRYMPEASANPSNRLNFPRWSLPKAPRPDAGIKNYDRHQTYDTRSGLGGQTLSKNRSSSQAHFGSSNRDGTRKLGTFASEMRGGASVKMFHAKF